MSCHCLALGLPYDVALPAQVSAVISRQAGQSQNRMLQYQCVELHVSVIILLYGSMVFHFYATFLLKQRSDYIKQPQEERIDLDSVTETMV